jgi:hypothetical protein
MGKGPPSLFPPCRRLQSCDRKVVLATFSETSQAKFIWRSESQIEGDDRKVILRLAGKDIRASRPQLGDFLRMRNWGKLFGPTVSELSFLAGGTFCVAAFGVRAHISGRIIY